MVTYCSVSELREALSKRALGTHFLDVRTPGEYAQGHIEGFVNQPMGSHFEVELYGQGPVYVHCHTDRRAARVAKDLSDRGVEKVYIVRQGFVAWVAAGYPIVLPADRPLADGR